MIATTLPSKASLSERLDRLQKWDSLRAYGSMIAAEHGITEATIQSEVKAYRREKHAR
jgi:hypothetical protein